MIDCENADVRDALPDLVNGRLGAAERTILTEHVASCAACAGELALLRAAREAAPLAPAIDVDRIASAIAPYGGTRGRVGVVVRPRVNVLEGRMWLFAAAALFVAIGGWAFARSQFPSDASLQTAVVEPISESPTAVASTAEPAPAVTVQEIQKTPVAAPAPRVAEPMSLSLVAGINDFSDAELETLLTALESMEALPSEEPEAVTFSIDDMGAER